MAPPSRVASAYSVGWGTIRGGGDAVPGIAALTTREPFLLAGQVELALANRVDAILGGGLLRGTPFTTNATGGAAQGVRWTAPYLLTGVRYSFTEGNIVDVGLSPLLGAAARTVVRFERGQGLEPIRLTPSGALGLGMEGDFRFPGGRCQGVISAQLSVRYMAWRWPLGSGARLDVRPLTVSIGIVIRH
jgi:hypothetical protein